MIKVKISFPYYESKNLSIFNFTNTKDNIFNGKQYFINSDVEDVDYWFVNENLKTESESVRVPERNCIYIGSETSYNSDYFFNISKKNFLNQFNKLYSPNYIFNKNHENSPPFLVWRLKGNPFRDNSEISHIDYYSNLYPKKTKILSVYCSNKQNTQQQKVRFNFVKELKEVFGDKLDWYGTGVNSTKTKENGICEYKYHIVLENQTYTNCISEKLYDSFLGLSFPIYAGAPNLSEYFSQNSYTSLNLNDFTGSIKKIKKTIDQDKYEENLKELISSRETVLENFNLIKRIDKIVDDLEINKQDNKRRKIQLFNKSHFQNKSVYAKALYKANLNLRRISEKIENYYI